jgi:hypothetical protein
MRTRQGIRLLELAGQAPQDVASGEIEERPGGHAGSGVEDGAVVAGIAAKHFAVPAARVHPGGPA